jgi:hypothetical protein
MKVPYLNRIIMIITAVTVIFCTDANAVAFDYLNRQPVYVMSASSDCCPKKSGTGTEKPCSKMYSPTCMEFGLAQNNINEVLVEYYLTDVTLLSHQVEPETPPPR